MVFKNLRCDLLLLFTICLKISARNVHKILKLNGRRTQTIIIKTKTLRINFRFAADNKHSLSPSYNITHRNIITNRGFRLEVVKRCVYFGLEIGTVLIWEMESLTLQYINKALLGSFRLDNLLTSWQYNFMINDKISYSIYDWYLQDKRYTAKDIF